MSKTETPDIQCPLPQAGAHGDFERCVGKACAWFDRDSMSCAILSTVLELRIISYRLSYVEEAIKRNVK
jgi:hypothetical protein